MKIKDILKAKGLRIIAVDSDASVGSAISKMVENNISAILVIEEGNFVGLFTERDALKCWMGKGADSYDKINIKEVMTKNIRTITPEEDVNCAMSVMIERNIRHLPVVEQGRIVSMISIRDIVSSHLSALETEIRALKDYISGG
jgi:IMP dehydrogenase